MKSEHFSVYDIEDLAVEPILFQTGYTTIRDYKDGLYTLSYPNFEVRSAFLDQLLGIVGRRAKAPEHSRKLLAALENGDLECLAER